LLLIHMPRASLLLARHYKEKLNINNMWPFPFLENISLLCMKTWRHNTVTTLPLTLHFRLPKFMPQIWRGLTCAVCLARIPKWCAHEPKLTFLYFRVNTLLLADPAVRAVSDVGLLPLGCWARGFESRWGHGCLSLMFIYCVVLCR
jgi:hypothetical protein